MAGRSSVSYRMSCGNGVGGVAGTATSFRVDLALNSHDHIACRCPPSALTFLT